MSPEALYHSAKIELYEIQDATIAVRKFGSGPHLLFIHGYPVNGYTWRKLLPELSRNFTCIVIDLPGLGDSRWTKNTDFTFTAQTKRLIALMDKLGIEKFSIIAQNTGATLARMMALQKPAAAEKLVLFNTEIPGHRPPFIPTYQKLAKLPGVAQACQLALRSKAFIKSPLGFGQFYTDKKLFDDPEYIQPYVDRFLQSLEKVEGGLSYQSGIEWDVIDSLKQKHADIQSPTLLLWGENDKTFPVALAEKMSKQFGGETSFVRLRNASLMPQEEIPGQVLPLITEFLNT